jgi:NAD dependent epimerase/dehydratase
MTWEQAYRTRHVLVTGGGGFIGSHLVGALVRGGACVRALLRYTSRGDAGSLQFLTSGERRSVEVVRGDIRDPHFVLGACAGVEVVFHLAALIGIPYSYVAPADYVSTNVIGTLNVLEAARRCGVARVIHTSTSEVYGTAQYRPIDEKHPLVAQSPYAASKIGADKLAESYYSSFNVPVVTVRPFNTFGPRQSGRAVVAAILSQLLSECEELHLGSLEPERDLTYVSDTVAGLLALGACDAGIGHVVNLGTGRTTSVHELARMCMRLTDREVPVAVEPERVRPAGSEVMALVSDNQLAKSLCGWTPRMTLEDGLRLSAAFIAKHAVLYHPKEYQR